MKEVDFESRPQPYPTPLDELEHPASLLILSNAPVSEWEQIPAVLYLVESLKPTEWRLLEQHVNEHGVRVTGSNIIHAAK